MWTTIRALASMNVGTEHSYLIRRVRSIVDEILEVLLVREIPTPLREWVVLGIRVFALQIEMIVAVDGVMERIKIPICCRLVYCAPSLEGVTHW